MSGRPTIICHMTSSIDGGLHPSRYSKSPSGAVKDWSAAYEALHERLEPDAWLVGRVTMEEMVKGEAHPPTDPGKVERPLHVAERGAGCFAVTIDRAGKVHFRQPDIGGDPVIVLLGGGVPDTHLAELAGDGISYVVSDGPEIDLAEALATLRREFGIERLLLEGGGTVNGSFLAAGLVDELSVLVAPALVGREGEQRIVSHGESGLAEHVRLSLLACERLDHDLVHLRYRVEPA